MEGPWPLSRSLPVRGAVPFAIPPPPHSGVGPVPPPKLGPSPGGARAISAFRGALMGCGRIDTILPGSGSRPCGQHKGGGGLPGLEPLP